MSFGLYLPFFMTLTFETFLQRSAHIIFRVRIRILSRSLNEENYDKMTDMTPLPETSLYPILLYIHNIEKGGI